jgi:CheY-like chemotaxis protein
LEKVPVNINQLLNNCCDIFDIRAKAKSIIVIKNFDSTQDAKALTDPTRIRQICSNLLSNAIKFTHKGQVNITSQLELRDDGQAYLVISVQDTGVGITEDQMTNLFSPFSQADVSTTRKFGGTGLGLSITQKICELMGGDISVESEPSQGSTFKASINLELLENEDKLVGAINVISKIEDLNHLSVLVVEDNEINQIVVGEMLKQRNINYEIANDGLEAIAMVEKEAIQGRSFSLILMDCQMPNMDGYNATKHIRQLPAPASTTPIIALTANAMSEDREKCFACGMNEYLSKPIERPLLYSMLEKFA